MTSKFRWEARPTIPEKVPKVTVLFLVVAVVAQLGCKAIHSGFRGGSVAPDSGLTMREAGTQKPADEGVESETELLLPDRPEPDGGPRTPIDEEPNLYDPTDHPDFVGC